MNHRISLERKIVIISRNLNYCLGVLAGLKAMYENDKIPEPKELEISPALSEAFESNCFLRSDELLNREELDQITFKELEGATGVRVKGRGVYHLYRYDSASFLRGLLNTINQYDTNYLSYLIPIVYSRDRTYILVTSQLSFTSNTFLSFLDTVFRVDSSPKEWTLGEDVTEDYEAGKAWYNERIDHEPVGLEQ